MSNHAKDDRAAHENAREERERRHVQETTTSYEAAERPAAEDDSQLSPNEQIAAARQSGRKHPVAEQSTDRQQPGRHGGRRQLEVSP